MPTSLEILKQLAQSDPLIDPHAMAGLDASRTDRIREMKRMLTNQGGAIHSVTPTPYGMQAGQTYATGAIPSDIDELQLDRTRDPFTGTGAEWRVQDVEHVNDEVQKYNRPDVTAIRREQQGDALSRLMLPAQIKGQYDVEAARQSQIGKEGHDLRMIDAQSALQDKKDAGMMQRVGTQQEGMMMRQRLDALQHGKAHAPLGFFASLVPRAQENADQAEIASIMAKLGTGTDEAGMEPPAPAAAPAGLPPGVTVRRVTR